MPTTNTCINCGHHTTNQGFFTICDDCDQASKNMANLLKNGLTLRFSDGTTETLRLDEDPFGMENYTYEQFSRDSGRW